MRSGQGKSPEDLGALWCWRIGQIEEAYAVSLNCRSCSYAALLIKHCR